VVHIYREVNFITRWVTIFAEKPPFGASDSSATLGVVLAGFVVCSLGLTPSFDSIKKKKERME